MNRDRLIELTLNLGMAISVFLSMSIKTNAQTQAKSLWSQPGGLHTSDPGHTILDDDFTDMGDVFTDNGAYIQKRGGLKTIYATNGIYPVNQIYENIKLDGSRYGIVKSSGQLAYIGLDNSYNVLLSTLPENARLWMIQYNNDCFVGTSDKTDRWKFTGTSLEISTYIPCSRYPLIYYDKAFAICISTPNSGDGAITLSGDESVLRYSKIGDLKQWDGDFWIGVNRNDGDIITGSIIYRGNLYVFKKFSTHQIMRVENEDNTDGERAVQVLANIGCIGQDTIKEVNGLLYWTSTVGVIEFNGTSYKIVSEDIQDDIDSLIVNDSLNRQSFTDSSLADFQAGVGINTDSTTINGSLTLTYDGNAINQQTNVNTSLFNTSGYSTANLRIQEQFVSSYTIVVDTIAIRGMRETNTTQNLRVIFTGNNGNQIYHDISYEKIGVSSQWITLDISTYNVIVTSGLPYYLNYYINSNIPGYKFIYSPQTSRSLGTYWIGNNVYSVGDWSYTIYGRKHSNNRAGSFTSQVRQLSNWRQFDTMIGNFGATTETIGDTSIKWYVSATTASEICNTSNMTQVSTGSVLAFSSGTYVMWYASMTTNDIMVSPKIDDITINYFYNTTIFGSSFLGNLKAYSDNLNLRYWLTGISGNATTNNVIYTYQQKNSKWTKHNLSIKCMSDFKGDFVMGTSALTGKILKYSDDYTTDDGTTITPFVKTKDIVLSTRLTDNKIGDIWYYVDSSVSYTTMTAVYYPNLKDTDWGVTSSIGLGAVSGYSDMFIKKKVNVSGLDRVRTIGVKITNFDKLYGFDMFFTPNTPGDR